MTSSTSADFNTGSYDNLLDGVDVVLGRTQRTAPSDELIFSVLATLEILGLTLLDQARRGDRPGAFGDSFDAIATRDRQHLTMLQEFSGTPVTTRFWLPEAVLETTDGALDALAGIKSVTASAYVLGVRLAAKRRNARLARMLATVASTEADHRTVMLLAASSQRDRPVAQAALAALTDGPAEYKTANTALVHVQRLGIGFDRRTPSAGSFVEYDPAR